MDVLDNRDLENAKKREYYNMLWPDITEETMDHMIKTAAPLDIPDIGGGPQTPPMNGQPQAGPPQGQAPGAPQPIQQGAPGQPLTPEQPKLSKKEINQAVEELQDIVSNLNFTQKMVEIRHDIEDAVAAELKTFRRELDEFLHKKVPPRKFFDTGGAYKEHLFEMSTQLLDEVLPYLFESIPDYSLIATQISKTYEDGTVENGMVAIRVSVDYNTYKYDFKVDVPVLNGIIQSPLYMQRGIKIIPLTKEAIETEINSMSFRKVIPEQPMSKPNLYNNVGENPLRRKDNQKVYDIENQPPQAVGLPPRSTWNYGKGQY